MATITNVTTNSPRTVDQQLVVTITVDSQATWIVTEIAGNRVATVEQSGTTYTATYLAGSLPEMTSETVNVYAYWGGPIYDTDNSQTATITSATSKNSTTTIKDLLDTYWDTGHITKPEIYRYVEAPGTVDIATADYLFLHETSGNMNEVPPDGDSGHNFETHFAGVTVDIRTDNEDDKDKIFKESRRIINLYRKSPGGDWDYAYPGNNIRDMSDKRVGKGLHRVLYDVRMRRDWRAIRTAQY